MAPKILISLIATLVLANLVNTRVNAAPTRSDTSQHVDSNNDYSGVHDGGEDLLKQIGSLKEQIENKSSVVGDSDAATTKSALEETEEAKEIIAQRIDNTAGFAVEDTRRKFNNGVDRKRRISNPVSEIRAIDQTALNDESEVLDEIPENIETELLSYDNSKGEDYDYENVDETQNETVTAKSKSGNKNSAKGQKKNGKGKTPPRKQAKRPNRTTRKFVINGINIPRKKRGRAKSKNGNRRKAKFGRTNG